MNLLRKSAAIVLAALLLFLTACSDGGGGTEGVAAVEQRIFNSNNAALNVTGDTVYFMTGRGHGVNYRLSYMDRATGYAGELCGKPECTHDNADCNAWVDGTLAMTVSEDRIYWANIDRSCLLVCSVALDGTDRRTEWASPEGYIDTIGDCQLQVCGDAIYLEYYTIEVVDGTPKNLIQILAIPRNSGKAYEVLPYTDEFDYSNFVMFPAEEGLFYCIRELAELGEDEWWTLQHIRLFDPATGKTQTLYDGLILDMYSIKSIWPTQDGLLIGGYSTRAYKLRYDTGELETFLEIGSIDRPYIYLEDSFAVVLGLNRSSDTNVELQVVSFEGEELSYAKYPPFAAGFVTFEGFDSEYFYFRTGHSGLGNLYIIPRDGGDVITLWDGSKEAYRKIER